jgi:hypothetical protein
VINPHCIKKDFQKWQTSNSPLTSILKKKAGKVGIKVLSLEEVEQIATKFRKLNPYDPELVPEILKIEDVNFVEHKIDKPFRQLYGYAISAKRYALYSREKGNIHIEKASGHGLGYLFAPKGRKKNELRRFPHRRNLV